MAKQSRKALGMGAEATVYLEQRADGPRVVKERLAKAYRHPLLDLDLRKSRTRREANILQKLPVAGPRLLSTDRESRIEMSFIDGPQVKALLDGDVSIARVIGERIALLHDADIIHGDLTTSNMIMKADGGASADALHLIDFGLSFTSPAVEDKAVDLHLFRQALESKHHRVHDRAFREFVTGYKTSPHAKQVLDRLKTVEARGRNKAKF